MKNGDYRHLFVVGKIYKVNSNHLFYDIQSSKTWQFTDELARYFILKNIMMITK